MNDIIEQNQAAAKSNLHTGKLDRRNQWDTHPIIGDRRRGQRRSAVSTLERDALLRPAKPAPFTQGHTVFIYDADEMLSLWICALFCSVQRVKAYDENGRLIGKGWQSCKTGKTFVTWFRKS